MGLSKTETSYLLNMQALRFMAASGVVFLHAEGKLFNHPTEWHGVAVFFCISGFSISNMKKSSAMKFLIERLLRITPSYWLATFGLLIALRMWGYWPIEHVLMSPFYIPHQSIAGDYPVLGVGWTLNLEVYFYALFALCMLVSTRHAPFLSAASVSVVAYLVPYWSNESTILLHYGSGVVHYFSAGIAAWACVNWLKKHLTQIRAPFWVFLSSILVHMASSTYVVLNGGTGHEFSPLIAATSMSMVICGAVSRPPHSQRLCKAIMELGGASYACYLIHTIIIELLRHHGIAPDGSRPYIAFIMVSSWVISVIWWSLLDSPIQSMRKIAFRKWSEHDLKSDSRNTCQS